MGDCCATVAPPVTRAAATTAPWKMIKKLAQDLLVDPLDGNTGSSAPIAQMRSPVHVADAASP